MSKIKIQGDGGGMGTFTIISPNTDTSNTITLPDTTGTLVTSSQDLIPTENEVFNLGSPTKKWKDLYLSGSTINLGGISISASPNGIVLPELTIGTGTNTVKLGATVDGKLEQTGTNSSGKQAPTINIPVVLNDLDDVDLTVGATDNQVLGYTTLESGTISTVSFTNNVASIGYHLTVDTFIDTISTLPDARPAGDYLGVTGTSSGSGTVGTFDISIYDQSGDDGVQNGAIVAPYYNKSGDLGHYRIPDYATTGTFNTSFTLTSTGNLFTDSNGNYSPLQPNQQTAGVFSVLPGQYTTSGSGTGATFGLEIERFDGAGNHSENSNYNTATNGQGEYRLIISIQDEENLQSGTAGDPNRVFPPTYSFGGTGFAAGDTITILGTQSALGLNSAISWFGSTMGQADVTFTITANGIYSDSTNITNVSIVSQGSGHSVGDIITIADADLGGQGVADFTMQVATIDGRQPATYTGVASTSSGNGTSGTFDIVIDSSGSIASATPTDSGDGNFVGDVISISDSVLGNGGSPDVSLNVTTIEPSGFWSGKDTIQNFSDFADVDTITTPPTNRQVLSWNNTNSNWAPAPNAMPYVVATTTELLALTNLTPGHKALVTELNRIYMYTGSSPSSNWRHAVSGWYALASITMSNAKPVDVTGVAPTYTLNDIGESLILTTAAVDPEQMPLTWSWAITTGSKTDNTTVVQRDIVTPTDTSNEFTITPGIYPWDTSSFSITFSVADDSLDTTDAIGAFTLTIVIPDWKDNSNWYTEVSNTDFNAADAASMDGNNAIYFGNSVDIDDDSDTVIVSDPRWARPTQAPGQTSGVQKVGAIHIYNKNTTAGYSTWTKNNQILVDPIDAVTDSLVSDASGGHGGFAGDVGSELWDITSTGHKIALSGNGENIAAIYGSGENSRVPTFKWDGGTSTYISGDSLYPVDAPIPAGNYGMVKGTNNFVASRQACVAMSKDGNVCIVGYPIEGQTGKTWTYADQRSSEVQDLSSTLPAFSIGDAIPPAGGVVSDFFEYSFVAKNQSNIDFPVDNNFCNFGAVYIYEKTSTGTNLNTPLWNSENSEWGLTMKLTGIDIVDNLGSSVDLSADGTIAIASAPKGSSAPYNSPANPNDRKGGYVTIWDSTTVAGTWTNVGTLRSPTNVIDTSGVPFGQHKYLDTFGPPDTLRTAGTYSNVTGTSSGSGVVGFFNITVGSSGDVSNVEVATLGTGHAVGDTITIVDADLGAGGAADFTFNVTTDTGLTGLHTRSNLGRNSISISGDGKTIAVGDDGATTELITDTGVYGTDIAPHSHAFDGITKGHPYPAGAVHIYKNISDTWTYIETILMSNGVSREAFGNGVDLNHNGMLLTIGAPFETTLGLHPTQDPSVQTGIPKTKSGAVYTYELSGASATVAGNWKQTNRLIIPLLENTVDQGNAYMGRPKISSEGKTIVAGHRNAGPEVGGRVEFWKEGEVNGMGDITGLAATYDFGFTGIIMGNFSTTGVTTEVHRINSNAIATGHPLRTPGTYTNVATTNFINSQGDTGVGTGLVIPTVVVRAGTGVYANPPVGTTGNQAGSVEFYFGTAGDISGAPSQFVTAGSRGTGYAGGDGFVILDSEVGGGGAPPIGRLGSQETGTNAYVSFLEVSQVSARPSGTYLDVTGTTSGAGTVGTFDIVVNSSGSVTSATSKIVGASPVQGDTITISDSSLGNGGIADLTMDIITVGVSDRNTKEIVVSVDDPQSNEIWWSFAITNNNSGKTILENRHTTPFQISSSATDDVSSYSSGSFVGPPLSTMNNFNQGTSVGIATNITTPTEMFGSHPNRVVGTYTVTNATTSGTGTIGTLQIVVKPASETPFVQGFAQITLTGLGTGHSVGDVITVSDADLGGGGAIDVFGTISSIDRPAGTYTGVTGTSSGAGTGASFDIVVDSTGDITNVVVVTLGTGNSVGDIITISDADLGNTGFADFTMTVATIGGALAIHRLFGNTNRPRSFDHSSGVNVGSSTPHLTDYPYVALNTAHPFTNPTGTGPENTFVIVPNSDANISGGSFDLTITATDSVNVKTATTTITLPV